jgi:hypothetical protein
MVFIETSRDVTGAILDEVSEKEQTVTNDKLKDGEDREGQSGESKCIF